MCMGSLPNFQGVTAVAEVMCCGELFLLSSPFYLWLKQSIKKPQQTKTNNKQPKPTTFIYLFIIKMSSDRMMQN